MAHSIEDLVAPKHVEIQEYQLDDASCLYPWKIKVDQINLDLDKVIGLIWWVIRMNVDLGDVAGIAVVAVVDVVVVGVVAVAVLVAVVVVVGCVVDLTCTTDDDYPRYQAYHVVVTLEEIANPVVVLIVAVGKIDFVLVLVLVLVFVLDLAAVADCYLHEVAFVVHLFHYSYLLV